MEYYLFVFSARKDAMALYDYCLQRRYSVAIVNTPREVSASCGVSVKVVARDPHRLWTWAAHLATFAGAYWVQEWQGRQHITRL